MYTKIVCRMKESNKKNGKIQNISYCRLLSYINDCYYIDYILERKSLRFCSIRFKGSIILC